MSIKEKFNDYFSLNDTDSDIEEEVEVKSAKKEQRVVSKPSALPAYGKESNKKSNQNIVAINQQQSLKKPQIKVIEPRLYSDVQSIADVLLKNQSVILNFRRMERDQAQKMLDFLMGTTYAIKGDIQRLGEEIFICTPQSFDVDGSDLQALKNTDY